MTTATHNDKEFIIMRNFHYKTKLSHDSVEHTTYKALSSMKRGKDPVDRASKSLDWIRDLAKLSEEALDSIGSWYREDKNHSASNVAFPALPPEVEAYRLRVLHEIRWVYNGNFHQKKYADSYPEVAFTVSTRMFSGKTWYQVTYGIVSGYKNSNFGTYSLFLTLEDVCEFLRREVVYTGSVELEKHYIRDLIARESMKKGKNLSKQEKENLVDSEENTILTRVNKYVSAGNVEKVLYTMTRCADISTLPDFARNILIPAAESQYEQAKEHAAAERRARGMEEPDEIFLDKGIAVSPDGVVATRQGHVLDPLPEPVDPEHIAGVAAVNEMLNTPADSTPTEQQAYQEEVREEVAEETVDGWFDEQENNAPEDEQRQSEIMSDPEVTTPEQAETIDHAVQEEEEQLDHVVDEATDNDDADQENNPEVAEVHEIEEDIVAVDDSENANTEPEEEISVEDELAGIMGVDHDDISSDSENEDTHEETVEGAHDENEDTHEETVEGTHDDTAEEIVEGTHDDTAEDTHDEPVEEEIEEEEEEVDILDHLSDMFPELSSLSESEDEEDEDGISSLSDVENDELPEGDTVVENPENRY